MKAFALASAAAGVIVGAVALLYVLRLPDMFDDDPHWRAS